MSKQHQKSEDLCNNREELTGKKFALSGNGTQDPGRFVALRAHCVCTAWALRAYCARRCRDTHPRIPVT